MFDKIFKKFNNIERKLENLIKIGVVIEVNYADCTARVKIGEIETNFLSFATVKAGSHKMWSPVEIGEQVLIFSPSGELTNGIIFGSLYSNANAAPNSTPAKEVRIVPAGIDVTTNKFVINGQLKVNGSVSVSGDVINGGDVISGGDQVAGSISTQNHTHAGCQGGSTGKPQ
ncbi:phage baseplate assembly protein V [Lentisphaerota bacterium WC36G]|nr:phage baseplate assembly protein V [Lentisphaerae bacterium WC36]